MVLLKEMRKTIELAGDVRGGGLKGSILEMLSLRSLYDIQQR